MLNNILESVDSKAKDLTVFKIIFGETVEGTNWKTGGAEKGRLERTPINFLLAISFLGLLGAPYQMEANVGVGAIGRSDKPFNILKQKPRLVYKIKSPESK